MRTPILVIVLFAACSKKEAAIAPEPSPPKRKPSWVDSFTRPLTATLYAPAGVDDKPYAALFERYRKVNAAISFKRVEDAATKLAIAYGKTTVTIEPRDGFDLTEPKGTSYLIARALHDARELDDGIKHRFGLFMGTDGDATAFAAYLGKHQPNYIVEIVDTARGDRAVASDFEGGLVTTPTGRVFRKELRRVDEFLMRGKPVALLANNLEIARGDALMHVSAVDTPMTTLLEGYGIKLREAVAIDLKLHLLPKNAGGKTREEYGMVFVAPSAAGRYDTRSPVFIGLETVVVPFPNELTTDSSLATTPTILLRSSDSILTLSGEKFSAMPDKRWYGFGATAQKRENREASLAVAFDGKIASAFPTPGDGVKDVPKSVERARLFVLSSAGFLSNPFTDAGQSPIHGSDGAAIFDPKLGADAFLLDYSAYYEPSRLHTFALAKQVCDWLLRRDEEIEP